MNLEQLRSFASVTELGSFSAAAERAGLTQPAISLQIRQLERHLGVRLVERVGRRVKPTLAGEELLVHAGLIEKQVSEAMEAMAPHRSGLAGRIRIGSGATACIYILPGVITRLKERMPGLEVTVRTGNTPEILRDLEDNRLDLAIVTLPAPGRAFEVEKIAEDELVAVASVREASAPQRLDADFLRSRTLLLYEGGHTRKTIDEWFRAAGQAARPAMEFGSVEAIKELVASELGWAILPRLSVCQTEDAARFTIRSLSPRLDRSLGLVVRRDKHLSKPLREAMQAFRA
jgi:DNA-binding transcriptional LysR family regulator